MIGRVRLVGSVSVAVAVAALTLAAAPALGSPKTVLTYETGPAYIAQNDGRYGENGTRYGADDVGQQSNLLRAERATVELGLGRHRVIALYAPFAVTTQVALAEALVFRETTFAAGTVVDHSYRFNGYRASYLYELVRGGLALEVGGSLQIRDADVAFVSGDGSMRASQSDIGLVPALKARLTYDPGTAWARVEADGLSTFGLVGDTSGGIYDVAISGGYPLSRRADLYGNVRLLGGGARVPDQAIDNWANYVIVSLGVRVELSR